MKSAFVILGLLVCTEAAVFRAEFVPTGEDLLLEVAEDALPYDFKTLQWKFDERDSLVTFSSGKDGNVPKVSDLYRGRVEVSVENFSVKLKNLQKSDSGVYTAEAHGSDYVQVMAEYHITVEDPVSPVNLTVDSVTNSKISCELTVTCRSLGSRQISISTTVTCNTTTCSQGLTYGAWSFGLTSTLDVYLKNNLIICDHKYLTRRTNDSIMIDHFCPRHTGSESLSAGVSLCLVKTVVFSVGLIIMVAAVISVHVMERLKRKN